MKFPIDYFEIQVKFVEMVAKISGKDFLDMFTYYSEALYQFGIDKQAFHPNIDVWLEFLEKYYDPQNKTQSYYNFAVKRDDEIKKVEKEPNFGYFSFEYNHYGKFVRLHTVVEPITVDQPSKLAHSEIQNRLNDLKSLFCYAKQKYPNVELVKGSSWLHNIEAYKRLFPSSYYENPQIRQTLYEGLGLWGQFLDKTLNIKQEIKDKFYAKLQNAKTFSEAMGSFDYQAISVKGNIKEFYDFYKV